MMAVRIFGAVCIAAASLYTGLSLSAWEGKRVVQLRSFCHLLETIRDSIGTMHMPIRDIYAQFTDTVLESAGFLCILREAAADAMCDDVLGSALQRSELRLALTASDLSRLYAFSGALGTEDTEGELRRCDYHLSRLRQILETAEAEAPAKSRICRVMSLSAGGLLVLMLF